MAVLLEGGWCFVGAEPRALSRMRTEVCCGGLGNCSIFGGCCRKSSQAFPLVPVEGSSVTVLGNWVS